MSVNGNKLGILIAGFLAVVHLIWSLAIAITPNGMQIFLNWIFKLHALQPVYVITQFNFLNMIFLLIVVIIMGYIYGRIFAWIWNYITKK